MRRWECRIAGFTPRALSLSLAVLLAGAAASLAAQSILPPDAAARAFDEGREAVRKGRYADGIRLLQQALATGHTQPKEQIGTTRGFVERYDPYYWMGVAYMETGDDARARDSFQRSRGAGLVERWPEGRDLVDRLARLDQREAARRPPAPTPAPTATRPPEPEVSIPAEGFTVPGVTPTRSPAASAGTAPTSSTTPVPTAERLEVAASADLAGLAPALRALGAGSWEEADRSLTRFRERSPGVALADLVDAVAKGSRYVLEGRSDAALLAEARRLLQSYRRRGGTRKAEEMLVSPSLASVLSY